MLGGYEEKPDVGDFFVTEDEETDEIEAVYSFDEDMGAWSCRGYDTGDVLVQHIDEGWQQVG